MKMEWIWPIRGMVGKLGLYILLWQNDIRKSCFYSLYKGVDSLIYTQGPTLTSTSPKGYSYMADVATKNIFINC